MYCNGRGVTQDDEKAVELFQQAVKQGEATAQFNLGLMYADGCGVAQDHKKAVELFQQAANQGVVDAKRSLELLLCGRN